VKTSIVIYISDMAAHRSNSSRRIHDSQIKAVHFYVRSDEETKQQAAVEVSNKAIFRGGLPESGGVYDPAMGTTDSHWNCTYCGLKKPHCLGHPGYMRLRYPVIEPSMIKIAIYFAKVVCLECGAFMLGNTRITKCPKRKLLAKYVAKTRNKKKKNTALNKDVKINMKCPDCGAVHPHIYVDKDAKSNNIHVAINQEFYDAAGNATVRRIYNHELLEAFDRVSDETVAIVGKPKSAHPRNLVSYNIVVPSNIIRPDKTIISGNIHGNNDITSLIRAIVEKNSNLPDIIPKEIDSKLADQYLALSQEYWNLHMNSIDSNANKLNKSGLSNLNGYKGRLPLKGGRIRNDLMGGRCFVMARGPITGDPRLQMHELGVPIYMCRKLYKDVIVGAYNYDECMVYFKNKRNQYPGCHSIIKSRTGVNHSIDLIKEDVVLEYGDIIRRDLINGDKVVFGRQPSLWDQSMRCFDVVVMFKGECIRFNPSNCVKFNADFDGDECYIACITHAVVDIEMNEYASVAVTATTHQDGAAIAGMFQNSLWAISKLTKSDMKMCDEMAMFCMRQVPDRIHLDSDKKEYTGRELVSTVLPDKLNMRATAFMYNPEFPIKYRDDEINVVIKNGKLVSGVLDLSTVGQRKHGTIFHIVNNIYGPRTMNRLVYTMQQLGDVFISQQGSTIHLGDIMTPKNVREQLKDQTAAVVEKYGMLFDDKLNGRIVPPIGMTIDEFYEVQAQETLQLNDHVKTVLANTNPEKDNLYHMVFLGKKGNKQNIRSIKASIGQQTILGRRLSWNKWRGSPYYTYFSRHPGSHGFITSSLSDGLTVDEVMAMSEETRYGLINKLLSTATTGHQNREANKNMESVVIGPYRRVMRNKKYIVQPLYGGQGIDVRNNIYVPLQAPFMSEEKLHETFHAKPEDFGYESDNTKVAAVMDSEFQRIVDDRNLFVKNMLTIESMYMDPNIMSRKVVTCFDIQNMLLSVIHEADGKSGDLDPVDAINLVQEFTDKMLPYVYTNRFQQQKQTRVPEPHKDGVLSSQMVIREYLCVKNLKRIGMTTSLLKIIMQYIYSRFKTSLISPGMAAGLIASLSLHEMYTQFMLDAHKRVGIGGTNIKGKLRGIELMVARPTKLMKNPSMLIHVKPEFENDKEKVEYIASKIETLYFRGFVAPDDADPDRAAKESYGIFFAGETFGNPEHHRLADTKKYIANMKKFMGVSAPADLSSRGILFYLNMRNMMQKFMDIQTLVYALRKYEDKIFVVHSTEMDETPSIYCIIRSSAFEKSADPDNVMASIERMILDTIVSGVDMITSASVREFQKSYVAPTGEMKQKSVYAITTIGTNLVGVLGIAEIDPYRVQTDSIHEMAEVFGIAAARQKIMTEMRGSFAGPAAAHYTIFADEMTFTGSITGITKAGANTRENDVLPLASYVQPMSVLVDAAINERSNPVRCASTSLMIGAEITDIGTSSVRVITDERYVAESKISVMDML
jgi:DNA-directed RNA polymerase II subunit RPB1